MSDKKPDGKPDGHSVGLKFDLGLGGVVFWAFFFACCGDPDLLDAVIGWIQRQP